MKGSWFTHLLCLGAGFVLCSILEQCKVEIKPESKVNELELRIQNLEINRRVLEFQKDSLIAVADSIGKRITKSKQKTTIIIENRDKRNIVIMGLPDGDLLSVFAKLDSIYYRNR